MIKKLVFLLILVSTGLLPAAQNVGIGETNPAAKLEVKGSVNPLQSSFLVKDGNNIPLISVNNNGRFGINTITPSAPLHVYSAIGGEIMRLQGATPYISFFDQPGVYKGYLWYNNTSLELGTAAGTGLPVTIAPARAIAATFKANGYVGLGITNPAYRLDVLGRIRIQNNGETPGIWFNNIANNGTPGFVGMFDDNNVGLYGSGAGWAFLMDVTNGHIGMGTAADNNSQLSVTSDNVALTLAGTSASATAIKLGNGKIVVAGAGISTNTSVFVHKATPDNTPSASGSSQAYTVINNIYCNNNPASILMVTMNKNYGAGSQAGYGSSPEVLTPYEPGTITYSQVVSPTSCSVFYNGPDSFYYSSSSLYARNKWCILTYTAGYFSSPLNFNFNVMVVNPS